MPRTIWWVRRDLRLRDNPALVAAVEAGDVVPVFILDPAVESSHYHRRADKRKAFLHAGLAALDSDLLKRGSRLIVRRGDPLAELTRLMREIDCSGIYAHEDYSPFARRRDAGVATMLPLTLVPGVAIRHPTAVLKSDGSPYAVFTPYKRAWLGLPLPSKLDVLPAPGHLPAVDADLESDALPEFDAGAYFPAGEAEAHRRLQDFARGADASILEYGDGRNRLDLDGTSALSPYFRFGMLSAREAAVAALEAAADASSLHRGGPDTWLSELIWRDFYLAVMYHFPDVLRLEFDERLRNIPWRNDAQDIEAWKRGRTGYPVIDAAMRQLAETGWMHNRARMLAASFLTKNLLVDWRIGEQWFMDQLVDGDPAANNGGWQWTAGVGTDAAPYFRVFNPTLQGKRFDPDGAYVKRWVPELPTVPRRFVHEPWRLPESERRALDYPAPIVDLSISRRRALEAFKEARE